MSNILPALEAEKRRHRPVGSVGSPACLLLDSWGRQVRQALGEMPYLVGSATWTKRWRDVDVRVLFPQAKWETWFGTLPYDGAAHHHPLWSAICTSFSLWGQRVTGLPIDFQIQHQDRANERFNGFREALGIGVLGWDLRQESYRPGPASAEDWPAWLGAQ